MNFQLLPNELVYKIICDVIATSPYQERFNQIRIIRNISALSRMIVNEHWVETVLNNMQMLKTEIIHTLDQIKDDDEMIDDEDEEENYVPRTKTITIRQQSADLTNYSRHTFRETIEISTLIIGASKNKCNVCDRDCNFIPCLVHEHEENINGETCIRICYECLHSKLHDIMSGQYFMTPEKHLSILALNYRVLSIMSGNAVLRYSS